MFGLLYSLNQIDDLISQVFETFVDSMEYRRIKRFLFTTEEYRRVKRPIADGLLKCDANTRNTNRRLERLAVTLSSCYLLLRAIGQGNRISGNFWQFVANTIALIIQTKSQLEVNYFRRLFYNQEVFDRLYRYRS